MIIKNTTFEKFVTLLYNKHSKREENMSKFPLISRDIFSYALMSAFLFIL